MTVDSKTLSNVYNFTSGSSHSESVLQVFNEFRDSRLFTDVIISVQGREFPCHRAMLSACSSYFRAMFCNDHRESHEISWTPATASGSSVSQMPTLSNSWPVAAVLS
uniref:BTB domain-containing protein n=1 Tax=Sinocyclocheilus grahami TaxID=75366 RepID=A0A672K693_SINGR